MPKLTLQDIGSGHNLATRYNANNDRLVEALENTLSRDGSLPNSMRANLDMGGHRAVNAQDAVSESDLVTLGQLPVPSAELAVLTQELISNLLIPRTSEEIDAGVVPTATRYPVLDVRRYGAVADYAAGSETDGQVPSEATDNLQAFTDAVAVATLMGGGVIRACGGGEFYVSNTIDARGCSNLYLYVEPGTTVRTTRYTSLGSLLAMGGVTTDGIAEVITNLGVFGGGTMRTFRPDHDTIDGWAALTAYAVGDYVLATDSNGDERAYYCKTAGTSGAADPPTAVNGSSTSGTAVFQDADNDNAIAMNGKGIRVIGMDIPAASGKPITIQTPNWSDIWILDNNIGFTNDKAIEVKGNQGLAGQEAAFGNGVVIDGNAIKWAGREGIEAEQPSFSSALNENIVVTNNLVRSAGNIASATGIRINRAKRVVCRGNRVLESSSNGYHFRLCESITGDVHSENAGASGVHLQQNSGFALDSIYVKDATSHGVAESSDVGGGYIGRLVVDGAGAYGYSTSARAGSPPVIVSYSFTDCASGEFSGAIPNIAPQVQGKIQSFVLTLSNPAGTLQHQFTQDVLNATASPFADRLNSPSATLVNTPLGTDASTAFAGGGKVSFANTNEFILDHLGAASALQGVSSISVVRNDTATPVMAALVRRTVDVNGVSLNRWHIQFRKEVDGAAFALDVTNIGAGKLISVKVQMYLA